MLIALSSGLRFRLAIAFAAFAAFCLVAPPALLAFGHGESTAHCLSMADTVNHGKAKGHDGSHHAGHVQPTSDETVPAPDQQMTCCGLFCLSAITPNGDAVAVNGLRSAHESSAEPYPLNLILDRLDRPPISLLFV
jgi:hypothetical protein